VPNTAFRRAQCTAEDQDAAIGGGARQDRQHREQQQVGEWVALSLATARVEDRFQVGEPDDPLV
jgi:hypothetical protein